MHVVPTKGVYDVNWAELNYYTKIVFGISFTVTLLVYCNVLNITSSILNN